MPKISEEFSGKWLKAEDVGRRLQATIEEVVQEEVGTGENAKPKLVLYMKAQEKGLILNKTNGTVLAELYGDNTDDWTGKRIVLKTEKVNFQGKMVPGIRVDEVSIRLANQKNDKPVTHQHEALEHPHSRKPAPPVTQEEADEDMDDDTDEDDDTPF